MVWQCLILCCVKLCCWHVDPSGITPRRSGNRYLHFAPCSVALSVSRLSALAHSRHWVSFTSFPRTGGALMKCSVGSGAVCSFQVETPEQVSCFLAGGGSNASLPWDPWDLAQSLEEDLICKLQQRGGFNLQVTARNWLLKH